MTVKGRFSLDTNILVYAVDRDAGERHRRSRELVGRAARRDCVLTVQALAEFFHATTRKNLLSPARAEAFVRGWLDVFDVVPADNEALVDAMTAVQEYRLSFWDAMLWATAQQTGCSALLMRWTCRTDGAWAASSSSIRSPPTPMPGSKHFWKRDARYPGGPNWTPIKPARVQLPAPIRSA